MDEAMDAAAARRLLIQRLESLEAAGVRQLRRAPLGEAAVEGVARSDASNALSSPRAQRRDLPDTTAGTSGIAAAEVSRSDVPDALSSPSEQRLHAPPARPLIKPPSAATPAEGLFLLADVPSGPSLDLAGRVSALDVIRREVAACVRCPHLAAERTQTVFGVGNVQARLCLFGEAPGADEDRQGEPFVGKAGQLLNKIIEACTLRREDVYILNVLKCRPPENRTPEQEEVAHCREYFERQLDVLRPEFICCLGSTAARALLRTEQTIGRLRGKFHEYRGSTVVCTYHPSYLLRNPAAKRDVWEDMKMLMRRMGIELERQ